MKEFTRTFREHGLASAALNDFPAQHCEARRETLDAYLESDTFVSSSHLRRFRRQGLVASQLHKGGTVQGSVMGEALHSLVLEPEVFATQYLLLAQTNPSRTGTAAQESVQPHCLDAWQWTALHRARDALFACEQFPLTTLLSEGEKELSIYWSETADAKWKARPDCFTPEIVLELKTTGDCRSQAFARTRDRLDYDVQAAHYVEAVSRLTGREPRFAFIAVELTDPYSVRVHELDVPELAAARFHLADLRSRYVATVKELQAL